MTCGATIDLYPKMPGNLVMTCAREPHSKRAWHKTADGDFAWKEPKAKPEADPKPPCEWFTWAGAGVCENCGRGVLNHKGLRWVKPDSPILGATEKDDLLVEWKDYGPERKFDVPFLTHCMGVELFDKLHEVHG